MEGPASAASSNSRSSSSSSISARERFGRDEILVERRQYKNSGEGLRLGATLSARLAACARSLATDGDELRAIEQHASWSATRALRSMGDIEVGYIRVGDALPEGEYTDAAGA